MNLKSTLKSLSYWTLPPGIKDTLVSIYSERVRNNDFDLERAVLKKLVAENSKFKNIHHGERCFILATGPSIKTQDLGCLQGELCIGVSQFFLYKDIKIISPKYHVLAPSHHPFNFDDLGKIFDGLMRSYGDDVTCFLGYTPYIFSNYRFIEKYTQYKNNNQYFIDYSMSQSLDESNYCDDDIWRIDKKPFSIRTVIYSAIQVAVYMGCKEIYLIGCDHDYLNDTSRVTNHHFYKEEDGVSDAEHLSSFTTERWFGEYYFRWKQYRLIREYAQQHGCGIFNATNGGMLDVFPRVRLEDIVVY
ncbi:hypothetical protein MEO94_22330 [Dolichospermum sp. ST_sed9]|nr:hypothetical protein [Dolichospermum sp. ST_sed9]